MNKKIKVGEFIHIRPVPQGTWDLMQGRFAPRVATFGKVLFVSQKGWVLVSLLNKHKRHIFNECFFENEIEVVPHL